MEEGELKRNFLEFKITPWARIEVEFTTETRFRLYEAPLKCLMAS